MYISPFATSRTFTVRLLPPRLPGRMSGSTWLHSSSVTSLGYRSLLRSYRARFSIVHIGDLSTTQAAPGRPPLHHKRLIRLNMFPNRLLGRPGPRLGLPPVLLGQDARWRHRGDGGLELVLPAAHHVAFALHHGVEAGLGDVGRV